MPPHAENLVALKRAMEDRYTILREVGRGGMATVYLARDLKVGRDVAIKVLHQDLAVAVGAERFKREVQIAASLTHPHILPVHDSGEADSYLYYVMPFVQGETLRDLLRREKQLSIDESVRLTREIASALDYAHKQGFVHRDIKPENILLEGGHALISDFGIARAISHANDEQTLTQTGVTLGTAAYMSPEQAAAERSIDGRSDIYSLACVFYEMLAGQPPFVAATTNAVLSRHALEDPPPVTVVRQTVPEDIEDILLQALAKSPADRFPTAAQFAEALDAASPTTVGSSRRFTTSTTARARRLRARRKRVWQVVAVAAPVVAAGTWFTVQNVWGNRPALNAAADVALAKRVAVLYFDDRSDGALRYLADGLTESLIATLEPVRELTVISKNGVAGFKDGHATRDSIAKALGVGTVVAGSVERLGDDRVHVDVRLFDGLAGAEIDRSGFDLPLAKVLTMRDTLAQQVARFLRRRLGEDIELRERRGGTTNQVAWALVLRADRARKDGEQLNADDNPDEASLRFHVADSLYAEAQAMEPSWSDPSARRSQLAFQRARTEQAPLKASALIDSGLVQAEAALAIDGNNPDALESRGALRYLRWLRHLAHTPAEQDQLLGLAEADLRQATTLNSSQANAWNLLSHLQFQKPDVIEAKLAAIRAYEEDAWLAAAPDILWRLYTASYDLEQFPDAIKWCSEGRTRFPDNARFVQCRLWLMTAKATNPIPARAWTLVDTLKSLVPADAWESEQRVAEMLVAAALANAGNVDSALRVLDRAHPTPQQDPEGEIISTEAFVRTLAGDRDGALRLIRQYLALNPEHRAGLAESQSWWWRDLRQDPRFKALVGGPR